jgi:hypothetical protein
MPALRPETRAVGSASRTRSWPRPVYAVNIDGDYGPSPEKAVHLLQPEVDAIIGASIWKALG